MQYNPAIDLQRGASHSCKTKDEKTQYNAKSKHNNENIFVIQRKRVKISLAQVCLRHKMISSIKDTPRSQKLHEE